MEKQDNYMEKKVPSDCFLSIQHSLFMADFLMPETQPIMVYI